MFPMPDGSLAPPGLICKSLETTFEDGLPDWLTLDTTGDGAGASATPTTTGPGGVALATAATTDAIARVEGPSIDLTQEVQALRFDVIFTGGYRSGVRSLLFGFEGASSGLWITAGADTEGVVRLHARNATEDTAEDIIYSLNAGTSTKRYRVTLTLYLNGGVVHVGEGDQVWIKHAFGSAFAAGTVVPVFQWQTLNGAAAGGTLHQLTVERWWR